MDFIRGLFTCSYPSSYATPVLSILVTTFLLSLTLSKDLNGYGAADPFAWHAAFMIVGFCLLMPLGVLCYVMDFGRRGNFIFPTLDSRRTLHGQFMFFASLCIVVGFAIAFTCHARGCGVHKIQNHLPWTWEPDANSPSLRSAHVVIGYIVVAATIVQSSVGLYKKVSLAKTGSRVFLQHSVLGPLVWCLGLLNIGLAGMIEYLEKNEVPPKKAWNGAQAAAIIASLLVLAAATVAHLRCGSKRHLGADTEHGHALLASGEDEEEAAYQQS